MFVHRIRRADFDFDFEASQDEVVVIGYRSKRQLCALGRGVRLEEQRVRRQRANVRATARQGHHRVSQWPRGSSRAYRLRGWSSRTPELPPILTQAVEELATQIHQKVVGSTSG